MRPKRTPTIATKLHPADHIKFEQFSRLEGKTKTELARDAILHYMRSRETDLTDERDSLLEKRLKKMEDRIASLLVKVGLDTATLYALFWTRSERETRRELFQDCYAMAVKRMKKRLGEQGEQLKQSFKEA
jgi:hypothetical protein